MAIDEVIAAKEAAQRAATFAEADARQAAEVEEAVPADPSAAREEVDDKIANSKRIETLARAAKKQAEAAKKAAEAAVKAAKDLPQTAEVEGAVAEARQAAEQAEQAAQRAEELEQEAKNEADAAVVAELDLKVLEFFEEHKDQIYNRLEECHDIAEKARSNKDMLFIAESLPIINGIIHVGSTREKLNQAINRVRREYKNADPMIVLSALVFIYVADRGAEEFHDNPSDAKREIWDNIQKRVHKLL